MTRPRQRTALVMLCLMLTCAGRPLWPDRTDCLVVPVSSADLPPTTRLRARVRIARGARELGLEVIARKGPEGLVVIGLGPQGMRLFAVRQRERFIGIEDASSPQMRYLALWLLDALHRGIWIEAPDSSLAAEGGTWSWEGERVSESNQDGHWRREFRRAGEPVGVAPVSIDYRGSSRGEFGFEIRNAWCSYEATLVPLSGAQGSAG